VASASRDLRHFEELVVKARPTKRRPATLRRPLSPRRSRRRPSRTQGSRASSSSAITTSFADTRPQPPPRDGPPRKMLNTSSANNWLPCSARALRARARVAVAVRSCLEVGARQSLRGAALESDLLGQVLSKQVLQRTASRWVGCYPLVAVGPHRQYRQVRAALREVSTSWQFSPPRRPMRSSRPALERPRWVSVRAMTSPGLF